MQTKFLTGLKTAFISKEKWRFEMHSLKIESDPETRRLRKDRDTPIPLLLQCE